MAAVEALLEQAKRNQKDAIARLSEFLAIRSISTDSAYAADCTEAAKWCVQQLQSLGFDTELVHTEGHPMVLAHFDAGAGAPHLLFYGHYDVQPVDPLSLWNSDPFTATLVDRPSGTAIYARGASDDKGQLMTFVEAFRSFYELDGKMPCSITVFFEGEEESGSPSMIPFLQQYAPRLQADLALVCDTGMLEGDAPCVVTMLRGMLQAELRIYGPSRDLHSGMYGGPAVNPIAVLSKILASLHDDQGRVALADFYEGVEDLSPEQREAWRNTGFDAENFLGEVGLAHAAGEADYSVLEQLWARPTLAFNGIDGGYTGEGFKTVLPALARCKISARLVGDQDPARIAKALGEHIQARLPKDCRYELDIMGADGATVMPTEQAAFAEIGQALSDEWGEPAVFVGCGGSIPVVGLMKTHLGLDSALVGFARDDDAIHSPNEKYDLRSFRKGINSWIRIISRLAGA